jgi:hypothetical protein
MHTKMQARTKSEKPELEQKGTLIYEANSHSWIKNWGLNQGITKT